MSITTTESHKFLYLEGYNIVIPFSSPSIYKICLEFMLTAITFKKGPEAHIMDVRVIYPPSGYFQLLPTVYCASFMYLPHDPCITFHDQYIST